MTVFPEKSSRFSRSQRSPAFNVRPGTIFQESWTKALVLIVCGETTLSTGVKSVGLDRLVAGIVGIAARTGPSFGADAGAGPGGDRLVAVVVTRPLHRQEPF